MAYQYVTKWITPPEAEGIARQFEAQAAKANDLAAQLMRVKDELDYRWEGNSKNNFFAAFSDKPSQLNSYAEELRAKANEIRSIKVSVTEQIWVSDPPKPSYNNGSSSGGGGGHSFGGDGRHDNNSKNTGRNKNSGKNQSGGSSNSGSSKKKNQWWDPFDWF